MDALGRELSDEDRETVKPCDYGYTIHEKILKDQGPLAERDLPRKFVARERPKALGSLIGPAWVRPSIAILSRIFSGASSVLLMKD